MCGMMETGAVMSECRVYRYSLWRIWRRLNEDRRGYALFIGLNPSTADAQTDDATICRCVQLARNWGYNGLYMANLFAWRARNPQHVADAHRRGDDPVGPENDKFIDHLALSASIVVAAWGNRGSFLGRDQVVRRRLPELAHLGLTLRGQPKHPLYLPSSTLPVCWEAAGGAE